MAGRKRKPGPRTKSGQLSRAFKRNPECRDKGTTEGQAKRHALINGSDPQLAATASGILLANGVLNAEQHNAAMRYAYLHAVVYGRVWSHACPLDQEPAGGAEWSEEAIARAPERLEEMQARLTPEQRRAVANLAAFGFVPQWFFTAELRLRALPDDARDRQALLDGLAAIAEASWRRVA